MAADEPFGVGVVGGVEDALAFGVDGRGVAVVDGGWGVAHKDQAAGIWCENATLLTGTSWRYMKVPQADFTTLQVTELSDLALIFGSIDGLSGIQWPKQT